MDPFGRTFNRLLAVFGLTIAFVAMASIISPQFSAASPDSSHALRQGQVIGRLIGAEFEVVIKASRLGPRYWVYDLNGSLLASDLTIEQLDQRFAGLGAMVAEMRSSRSARMGAVDPARERPVAHDR